MVRTENFTRLVPHSTDNWSYDLRGNKLNNSIYSYEWDELDRLTAVETNTSIAESKRMRLEFEYDPFGRRTVKRVYHWSGGWALVKTVKFAYAGWLLLAELDEDNNLLRSYTWGRDASGGLDGAGGVGGLMAVRDHVGGRTYWPVYDGQNNVTALVDAEDEDHPVLATMEYGPYGELMAVDAPAGSPIDRTTVADYCPFLFSTKYLDAEVGLYYYGYRYYEPGAGRWLNRDPLAEEGGLNLYAFCGNDPGNVADPLGLDYSAVLADPSNGTQWRVWYRAVNRWPAFSLNPFATVNYVNEEYKREKITDAMDDIANTMRPGVTDAANHTDEAGAVMMVAWRVLPIASQMTSLYEISTGKEAVSGAPLSTAGYVLNGLDFVPNPADAVAALAQGKRILGAMNKARALKSLKELEVADEVLKEVRTVEELRMALATAAKTAGDTKGAQMLDELLTKEMRVARAPISAAGKWTAFTESMSERAAAYQAQITGRTEQAYVLNGVRFDGMANNILLDAKGPGYANFVKNGEFQGWFTGKQGLIDQAWNQVRAANGAPIQWHVAEQEAIPAFQKMLNDAEVKGIQVIHTPVVP